MKSLSPISIGWRLAAQGAVSENESPSGTVSNDVIAVSVILVIAVLTVTALIVIVRLGILPRLKRKKKAAPKRHIDYRA